MVGRNGARSLFQIDQLARGKRLLRLQHGGITLRRTTRMLRTAPPIEKTRLFEAWCEGNMLPAWAA